MFILFPARGWSGRPTADFTTLQGSNRSVVAIMGITLLILARSAEFRHYFDPAMFNAVMFSDQQNADTEQTITLSRTDLRAARRLLRLLLGAENEAAGIEFEAATVAAEDTSRTALIGRAREEFANRHRRLELFDRNMFGEAAWDMLLSLYILDVSGQRQTLGSLVKFSRASMTTAIRWINFLADQELVVREPHPTDLRSTFIRLTPKARDKLDTYYSDTVTTGV